MLEQFIENSKARAEKNKIPSTKNKIKWGLVYIGLLFWWYALCGTFVLGSWHGMYEFPLYLCIAGVVVIIIAAFFYCREVIVSVPAGYIFGHTFAYFFHNDYSGAGDPQGIMSYNNAWIIWAVTLVSCIAIGLILAVVSRYTKRKKETTEA